MKSINAFNNLGNMDYQYQGHDIDHIGYSLITELNKSRDDGITYVSPLVKGQDLNGTSVKNEGFCRHLKFLKK
jgi:hypothetical protein